MYNDIRFTLDRADPLYIVNCQLFINMKNAAVKAA